MIAHIRARSVSLVVMVAAALAVVGCGGGKSPAHTSTSTTPTTPVAVVPAPTSPAAVVPAQPTSDSPTLIVTSLYALISINEDVQFAATLALPDGTTQDVTADVTWSSSDASVATISNEAGTNGVALGVLAGSTMITASYTNDGETYTSAPVSLQVQPDPILRTNAITPEDATLTLGCNPVSVTAFGVYGDDSFTTAPLTGVVWTSADEAVATVSADGVVTAVGLGTTTITASAEGFAPVKTTVTVTNVTVLSYLSVKPGSIKVGSPRLVSGVVAFSCPVAAETTVRLAIANVTATEPNYAFFADSSGRAVAGAISVALSSGLTAAFGVTTVDPNDGTFGLKRVKHRVQITATREPDADKSAALLVRP